MKKLLVTSAIISFGLFFSAFKTRSPKPILFSAIEQYYKNVSVLPIDSIHLHALNNLTSYLIQSTAGSKKINLVFACADNSFESIAAQLVLQTLVSVNKIKKLDIASCGYKSTEVSLELIRILRKHGFKVMEHGITAHGANSYEVTFSDQLLPIILYAKNNTDSLMPQNNFFLMKMCDPTDTICENLQGSIFSDALSFTNPEKLSPEDKDKEFSIIASEMIYAFNKFKNGY